MNDPKRYLITAALPYANGLKHVGHLAGAYLPRLKGATPAIEEASWLASPRTPSIAFLSAPAFAPLRRDARFLALAEKVGLLAVWRADRLPDFCTLGQESICAAIRR